MKIKVTMKDPDGVYDSVKDTIKESVDSLEGLSDDEKEELVDTRFEDEMEKLKKFFKYGEYLTVEVDTDTQEARVVPV